MKSCLHLILLAFSTSFFVSCSSFPTNGIKSISITSQHGYTVVTPENDTLHSAQTGADMHELTLSVKSNHVTGVAGAVAGLPHSPDITALRWQLADSAFSTMYYGPLADNSNEEITFDADSRIELLMLPADTGYVVGSELRYDNTTASLQCKIKPYLQRRSYTDASKIGWGTFAGFGVGMLLTTLESKNELVNGKWGKISAGTVATAIVAPLLSAVVVTLCGDSKSEGGMLASALKGAVFGALAGIIPTGVILALADMERIQPTFLFLALYPFFGAIGATIGYNSSTPHARLIAIPPGSHLEIKYPQNAPPMFLLDTEAQSLQVTPMLPDVGMLPDGNIAARLSLFSITW